MTKNPVVIGLGLYGVTMLLFFGVYYFFAGPNYWDISMKINAFGLTFIYGIAAFLSTYWLRKGQLITYPQAFKQSFVTLFVGGFLSMATMFGFLNYVDTGARDLLNYQYVQTELSNLEEAYQKQKIDAANHKDPSVVTDLEKNYKEAKEAREVALKEKRNYFSFEFLGKLFAGFLLFYLLLSIIIAAFLKNKKRYE